jgi:cytochrome c biogenesis protein CcdA
MPAYLESGTVDAVRLNDTQVAAGVMLAAIAFGKFAFSFFSTEFSLTLCLFSGYFILQQAKSGNIDSKLKHGFVWTVMSLACTGLFLLSELLKEYSQKYPVLLLLLGLSAQALGFGCAVYLVIVFCNRVHRKFFKVATQVRDPGWKDGDEVLYTHNGKSEKVVIKKVHHDDVLPYYTIYIPSAKQEKQTVLDKLGPLTK